MDPLSEQIREYGQLMFNKGWFQGCCFGFVAGVAIGVLSRS